MQASRKYLGNVQRNIWAKYDSICHALLKKCLCDATPNSSEKLPRQFNRDKKARINGLFC